MSNVVIAYNSKDSVLGGFFTKCADKAKLTCQNNGHTFTEFFPPKLTESNVIGNMSKSDVCFLASHGDRDGIIDDKEGYIVSTRTTNYNFIGKIFYTVSCYSALNLKDELLRIGIKAFIGYDDEFKVGDVSDEKIFVDCAVSGFEELASGATISDARSAMLAKYDFEINRLSDDLSSPNSFFNASLLLNDKEHLCFE